LPTKFDAWVEEGTPVIGELLKGTISGSSGNSNRGNFAGIEIDRGGQT